VRELCQFTPEDELEVWEEVHLKNIATNKLSSTLEAAKLRSGMRILLFFFVVYARKTGIFFRLFLPVDP
jgi:hypothetical protein